MLIATRDLGAGHALIHGDLPPELQGAWRDGCSRRSRAAAAVEPAAGACHRRAAVAALGDRARGDARGRQPSASRGRRGRDPDRAVGLAARRRRPARPQTADGRRRDRHVRDAGRVAHSTRRSRRSRDGTALRIDRGGLFELLADHTDLLQGIFSICCCERVAGLPARRGYGGQPRSSGRTISNTVSTP